MITTVETSADDDVAAAAQLLHDPTMEYDERQRASVGPRARVVH